MSYSAQRSSVTFRPPQRPPATLHVRVARTADQLAIGLMGTRYLPPDEGLLMIFHRPDRQTLWMKHVPIPLDLIFIDASQKVVGVIENAEPLSTRERAVARWSSYVVEANGGYARSHGIALGTPVVMFVLGEN